MRSTTSFFTISNFGENDMKNAGKKFEQNFKQSCEKDSVFCLRLTDSDLSFNPNKELRSRFTVKQPCDLIVYYKGFMFTLELKNTKGKNFSFQRDLKVPDGMIHYHQINSLVNMGLYDGIISGFVFNFRWGEETGLPMERTFFLNINDFSKFMVESDKRSINMNDIIEYGGVEIENIKRRTQYTYKILDWLEKMVDKI